MRYSSVKFSLTTWLLTIACCAFVPKAEALLASIKSSGMAATATAFPLDSLCIAYNPAAITELQDRIDFGAAWDHSPQSATIYGNQLPPQLHINGHYNASRRRDFLLAEGGAVKHLGCNMALGLAVYNRDFNKTTYTRPVPLLGTSRLDAEYAHEIAALAWSMKVLPCLSVGVVLNYHLQRAKLNGVQRFENFSSNPGHVSNNGYNYSHGWGYGIGALWNVTRCINIGASYQPKVHMSRFKEYSGFLAQQGRINVPDIITAGIAYSPLCSLTFAFDYQHVAWSQVNALHNPLEVPNPSGPDYQHKLLGGSDGPGFGFRSQDYLRFGVNWDCCDWLTLRAGFRHVQTPVRRSQTAANLLTCDVIENVATCGATWRLQCGNELSFLYAHGFENTVHGKDSFPPTPPFGGGNVDLRQQKNVFGLSWGKTF